MVLNSAFSSSADSQMHVGDRVIAHRERKNVEVVLERLHHRRAALILHGVPEKAYRHERLCVEVFFIERPS